MKVKELIAALGTFDPESEVQLCMNWPGGVAETHRRIWVGNHASGPQINAAVDFRGVTVYVGCSLDRAAIVNRPLKGEAVPAAKPQPSARPALSLGRYESAEIAAHVRDFYVYHHKLNEPLNFPDFDYERWIPPKTVSGEYNKHIAEILREKLLKD